MAPGIDFLHCLDEQQSFFLATAQSDHDIGSFDNLLLRASAGG